jgi:hypothetical protein
VEQGKDEKAPLVSRQGRFARARSAIKTWHEEDIKGRQSSLAARASRRHGPLGAFVGIARLMNRQARLWAIIGIVLGVLFIPVGFFTFSGWAIAALAMVIISAFYLILLNIFKALASMVVAFINAVFSVIGGIVIKITEAILGAIGKTEEVCFGADGSVTGVSTFCNGHSMLGQSLIAAGELNAIVIPLLDPEKLKPQMDTTPWIQKLMGWFDIKFDLGPIYAKALGGRFMNFVETGNIYMLIAVFVIPTLIVAWLFYSYMLRPALIDAGVKSSG